jgi:hypothetical protein
MAQNKRALLDLVKRAPDRVVTNRMGEPDDQGRRKLVGRDYSSKSLGISVSEEFKTAADAKKTTQKTEAGSKEEKV